MEVEAPGTDELARTMEWFVPPIGERPNQPITFYFPQREFGQKTVTKRSFQAKSCSLNEIDKNQ